MPLSRSDKLRRITSLLDSIEKKQLEILRLWEENRKATETYLSQIRALDSSVAASRSIVAQHRSDSSRHSLVAEQALSDIVRSSLTRVENAERESQLSASDAMTLAQRLTSNLTEVSESSDDDAFKLEPVLRKRVYVDLNEIEDVMLQSPFVAKCRAFGRPDAVCGQALYCVIVPEPGAHVSDMIFKLHAKKHLEREQRPRQIFVVDTLPEHVSRNALAGAYGPSTFVSRAMAFHLQQYRRYTARDARFYRQ